MKLIQQTPTVQRLEIQKLLPIWVGIVGGLSLVLLVISLFLTEENLTVLQCNRRESEQIDCEISRSNWLQTYNFALVKDLQAAEVRRFHKHRRIILNTTQDQITLVSGKNRMVSGIFMNYNTRKINNFIQSSEQERLDIRFDDRWMGLLFMTIIILLIGDFIVEALTNKRPTYCIFDQKIGKIYITYQNSFESELKEIEFKNIIRAKVIKKRTRKGDLNYTLSLVKSTNEVVELKTTDSREHYDEITKSINHLMDITSLSREQ